VETIRLGIVGLGRLGYQHAENIAYRTPGGALGAYCSIIPAELERAGNDFPAAQGYSNYMDMLADKSLDAIFICSPSGLHCQHIEAALKAGFHVFSEKPLGVNVAECEYIEKVVARYPDQVFMLGFMRRYDESYAYAKKLIDEGRIGTPFMVRSTAWTLKQPLQALSVSPPPAAASSWIWPYTILIYPTGIWVENPKAFTR
jgi:myo-inositol 2-dehydrogenase / D-chiro-inositol 1-dehydrogenase